jgi:hypothetical protein
MEKHIINYLIHTERMNEEEAKLKAESYENDYSLFEEEFYAVFDEIDECYISQDDSGYCQGQDIVTHIDNLFYCDYSGNYFSKSHYVEIDVNNTRKVLSSYYQNDLHLFDLYYWSDGEIYEEPEPEEEEEEEEEEEYNFSYHGSSPAIFADYSEPKIGFEIEKEDIDAKESIYAYDLQRKTGWGKENDGSLNSDSGFELVSPVFPLHKPLEYFESKFKEVENLINADYSKSCGGHINYSNPLYNSEDLLNEVSGWIPLIYSLYEYRLKNTYCEGKSLDKLKEDRVKYQAINIKSRCLEFRIFPAVKNVKNLLWRLRLIQLIDLNKTKSPAKVIEFMSNEGHELHKHLIQVFPLEKLIQKINKVAKFSEELTGEIINQDTINQFTQSIQSKIK